MACGTAMIAAGDDIICSTVLDGWHRLFEINA
jgi:hypothetical protein